MLVGLKIFIEWSRFYESRKKTCRNKGRRKKGIQEDEGKKEIMIYLTRRRPSFEFKQERLLFQFKLRLLTLDYKRIYAPSVKKKEVFPWKDW